MTRGEKALFDMISSIENYNGIHVNMKLSLFDSLVKSVILYGCEIWGFFEAKQLDTFYLRFLKHTLYVRKTTPTCFVYKECNVYLLYITRISRIINYWIKILSLDESSTIKILYNIALDLNEHSTTLQVIGSLKLKIPYLNMVLDMYGLIKSMQLTLIFFLF